MSYDSTVRHASAVCDGVVFQILRMSFGRRVELMRRVRELAGRAEFLAAGQTDGDRMEASILGAEIDRLYVEWGVADVTGLTIDGVPAGTAELIDSGPEGLLLEALELVKKECGLSETERKN